MAERVCVERTDGVGRTLVLCLMLGGSLLTVACNEGRTGSPFRGDPFVDASGVDVGSATPDAADVGVTVDAPVDGMGDSGPDDTGPSDAAPMDTTTRDVDVGVDAPTDVEPPPCEHMVVCREPRGEYVPSMHSEWSPELWGVDCTIQPEIPQTTRVSWNMIKDGETVWSRVVRSNAVPLDGMGAGEFRLQAEFNVTGRTCEAAAFQRTVEPPRTGLYFEFAWSDGDSRGVRFDVDLNMVRDGFCYHDLEQAVFHRTIDERLDWGLEGETQDDPQFRWDSIGAPGTEVAWIPAPADDEVVHLAIFGYRVPDTTDPIVHVKVYVDGTAVLDDTVETANQEWTAIGAVHDGALVPSVLGEPVEETHGPCPRLEP